MEILVCLLLAAMLGGGRIGADIVHAVKGTSPPHLEKARLKASSHTGTTGRPRSPLADGKPRLRDVAAVYWGDAMQDAIDWHNRRRAEKRAQRVENIRAAENGERPAAVRPPLVERMKRFGRWLINPVGETGEPTAPSAATRPPEDEPQPDPSSPSAPDTRQRKPDPNQPSTATEGDDMTQPVPTAVTGPAAPASTGEAVNYETTVAELEALIARLREHLDSVTAAHASVQQAKADINTSQTSYNPAAAAAASISEHLPALNVDAETVGHTGTVANAMPPNAVNEMFDRLEAMEQTLSEQKTNAEAALGSAEQALKVVQAKYGDAHATVAGELSGDSRFLADSAA